MGSLSLAAVSMTIDHINTERCGVTVQGQSYSLVLTTYGDNSDPLVHRDIGEHIVMNTTTDFLLGGYSSALTHYLAPTAETHKKLLVAGGSSSTDVYKDRGYVFGILPPADSYLEQAFAGVARAGAKTVATVQEEGQDNCRSAKELSEKYNLTLLEEVYLGSNPTSHQFDAVAYNMSNINPDVMFTCVYDYGCADWIRAMRATGWSPKAQVFTMCLGALGEAVDPQDLSHMMGAASWDRALVTSQPDPVTGWTAAEFAERFELATFRNASYQHTAAATAVSVIVQAIEFADSLNATLVAEELRYHTYPTMYGETSFDTNGQNEVVSLLLQYDTHGRLHVVYPESSTEAQDEIVYPMPTWDHRDCLSNEKCAQSGGHCLTNGTCGCDVHNQSIVSFGLGATAFCKIIPLEDKHYIDHTWMVVGVVLVVTQALLSLASIIWTLRMQYHSIVSASQPEFLVLISIGCFVQASSIIPLFIQGDYRYLQDYNTGKVSTMINPDVKKLDAACMAFPWLSGLGFVIIFSALFAKIWRVKKLLRNAQLLQRKVVEIKDVISVMVVMLTVEVATLLAWQIFDPLRWERKVLSSDPDGFPVESVGYCSSEKSFAFILPLCVFNGGSLVYALYLCWVTRNVPSDFSEGSWITLSVASIFQILILAVPVLLIASEDRNASFFVRAAVVFLVSSTVTFFIFGPKLWRIYHSDDTLSTTDTPDLHPESKDSNMHSQSSVSRDYPRGTLNRFCQGTGPSIIDSSKLDSHTTGAGSPAETINVKLSDAGMSGSSAATEDKIHQMSKCISRIGNRLQEIMQDNGKINNTSHDTKGVCRGSILTPDTSSQHIPDSVWIEGKV